MNNEIDIKTLKPFTRFICTIGELPTSYVVSMSYEEQLLWLCNYLEKTVIPTLNNNSLATQELQERFIELKEYVDAYFDNLDIQEEVDNKLEEMYENGQLQSLIEQFIDLQVTFTFDTIEDMKEATNLVDKSNVKTLGFYSLNDGGDAYYRVRPVTTDDTIDEKVLFALSDNTLVAELIIQNVMTPKQFGAKGDGETDDTDSLNLCLEKANNTLINNGVYMIDVTTPLLPQDNSNIIINDATIQAIANSLETYSIINIDDVSNVIISGNGTIKGDKTTHTGLAGEHGHCIKIGGGATNILIKDISIIDGWGDGLYIGDSNSVIIDNVKIDNNSRNGISIVKTNDCKIINSIITGTDRTTPKSAIDIEPNESDSVTNVLIENCIIKDNTEYGIILANRYPVSYPNAISNININNNIIDNNKVGIRPQYTNKLIISNNNVINNSDRGINIEYTNNAIINGNQLVNNGYALNVYLANNNIISNNVMMKSSTTNPVINVQGSKYNLIKNNKIKDNKRGINLTSTTIDGTTYENSYNRVEENDIYNNSVGNSGTYHNITLSNTSLYNFIKNNNFIGELTDDIGYNIQVASTGSRNNNYIIGNIMLNGNSGAVNIYNNKTLDNLIGETITTISLQGGNLRV